MLHIYIYDISTLRVNLPKTPKATRLVVGLLYLSYGCGNLPYNLREEPRLRVFENRVSRKILGRPPLKCDGTRAETRFRLSAKRTSPF